MALDPRLLESFVILAREMHVGRASERLLLTQPALSKQLQRLERQVGARLFDRSSRTMTLTPAGQAMLDPAERAVQAAAEAAAVARAAAGGLPAPLRLGVDIDLDDALAPVGAFAGPRPDIELWLSRHYEAQGHAAVAKGHIDAFVGYRPVTGPGTTSVKVFEVPLLAVVPTGHRLAEGSRAPLEEYRRFPIAIFARDKGAPGSFEYVVDLLSGGAGAASLELLEVRTTSSTSYAAMLAEVASGRAVSFTTSAHMEQAPHLRALPFDPPLAVPVYASFREPSPIVQSLVDSLHGSSPVL